MKGKCKIKQVTGIRDSLGCFKPYIVDTRSKQTPVLSSFGWHEAVVDSFDRYPALHDGIARIVVNYYSLNSYMNLVVQITITFSKGGGVLMNWN